MKFFSRRRNPGVRLNPPRDFDEAFYLSAHEDVASAVARGDFASGFEHFEIHGTDERRAWSTLSGLAPFARTASFGAGIYLPKTLRTRFTRPISMPSLSGRRATGQLLILVPHLRAELFYAGYSSFFAECAQVAVDFTSVRVICFDIDISAGLLDEYLPGARIDSRHSLSDELIDEPDLIITFDTTTTLAACDTWGLASRTIYYCQDFEAGFHPYGFEYTQALRALHVAEHIVVSTPQLKDFLERGGYLSTRDVSVTVPQVKKLRQREKVQGRVFVYFRPEAFNARNMADLLLPQILEFCETHAGYEFFLVGTVATDLAFVHGENSITVLSKLSFERYEDLVMSSEVAISLIYSAHPGVVAYQAALSGIPTITNVFDNRSAADLRSLSPNLIPFDVVRDSFDDVLAQAFAHQVVSQESFRFGDVAEGSSVEYMRGVGRRLSAR